MDGQLVGMTTVGRIGTVQDVANLVSFLASQESAFITGEVPSDTS